MRLQALGFAMESADSKAARAAGDPAVDQYFVMSSEIVDRAGEVIDQDGWRLDSFRRNPVMLASHQHRLASGHSPVIGSWPVADVRDGRLVGGAKFAPSELGREYKALYLPDADGVRHMRAVSVGFESHKQATKQAGGKNVLHHVESELYECSACAVGCNPEALAKFFSGGEPDDVAARLKAMEERLAALPSELRTQNPELDALKAWVLEQFDELKALIPDRVNSRSSGASPHSCAGEDGAGKAHSGDQRIVEAATSFAAALRGTAGNP